MSETNGAEPIGRAPLACPPTRLPPSAHSIRQLTRRTGSDSQHRQSTSGLTVCVLLCEWLLLHENERTAAWLSKLFVGPSRCAKRNDNEQKEIKQRMDNV